MTIRRFSLSDLGRILEIEGQAFPKSAYPWTTFINLHLLYPETFLVYAETLEGRTEETIFGYLIFSRDGHLLSLAVDPAQRRRGIGRKLLERVFAFPRIRSVRAEVRKSNSGARAFYSRMGFRIVGSISNYYGNEDALIVEWTPAARPPAGNPGR
jgi:[ribosomal protein S18]-alanine N-acetyltransferase